MKKDIDEFKEVSVEHKIYGTGIVTENNGINIYVDFEGKTRIFPYPDAFTKEYLTIVEPDIEIEHIESAVESKPNNIRHISVSNGVSELFDKYYSEFPLRWDDQKYLWKCVRTFQDLWDLNATDLSEMIERATVDADYLMNASLYYPREQIIGLAARNPQEVREMFVNLFDESKDLVERSQAFNKFTDQLRQGRKGKAYSRNYQTMNAVSMYLWLKYPNKYYFYKHSVGKKVSSATGFAYTKQRLPVAEKMVTQFALFDQVSIVLRQDNRFRKLLDERLDSTLYADEQLHCMAMDFGFFLRPLYENRRIGK